MAKTVGLPLGIAARLLIQGKIKQRGVVIPVHEEIYKPVLAELNSLGISFVESESEQHKV
jgi:saccharopine dehydrogenase-like NADP-dependent oxidoreductase